MSQASVETHFKIKANKTSNAKCGLLHSFRPIYIVSRICGQMPFSIAYNSNGEIDRPIVNKLDAVWFAMSISLSIIFILQMYYLFTSFDKHKKSESEISLTGFKLTFVIIRFPGLLAIILDMYYRVEMIKLFKKITVFDERASSSFSNLSNLKT